TTSSVTVSGSGISRSSMPQPSTVQMTRAHGARHCCDGSKTPRLHRESQRRCPVLRVRGVRSDRAWPGWPEWVSTVAAHAVSWTTVGTVLASLVLMGVFRLLAEWQRRTTLVAL